MKSSRQVGTIFFIEMKAISSSYIITALIKIFLAMVK